MEGNKDESERCRDIGLSALKEKDYAKALKYFQKSQRLFPIEEVANLISVAQRLSSAGASTDSDSPDLGSKRENSKSSKSDESSNSSSSKNGTASSTVHRILACKRDLYQVLEVSKDSSQDEIKKAYRKLSLKVHPDKNSSAGAEEAFKVVSRAFQVLSDETTRAEYNMNPNPDAGLGMRHRSAGHGMRAGHGFPYDGEGFDPNDVFQAFFGGNPHARVFRTHFHQPPRQPQQRGPANLNQFMAQLLPLFALLMFMLIGVSFNSEKKFRLEKDASFGVPKETSTLGVPFFVKSVEFDREYPLGTHSRRQIELAVESEYKESLETGCYYERVQQSQIYRYGHHQKARDMDMPNCRGLENLQSRARQERQRMRQRVF